MRGVNKVILLGTLGKEPDVKRFDNGGLIANFSIATSERWKDKNTGEPMEHTEWHRIVCNNRLGEIAGEYLKKGSKVYIEGSLRTRQWTDQNGTERYTTEVRCEKLQLLDGKPKEAQPTNTAQSTSYTRNPQPEPQRGYSQPANTAADLDDDLPF